MELIDNKDYIVGEIERSANEELDRLREGFERERSERTRTAARELDAELATLRGTHAAELETLRKRTRSSADLAIKRMRLEAESRLRRAIVERLRAILHEAGERSERIAISIVEELRAAKPRTIEGPRWIELEGVEPTLETFAFRAHLSDGSLLEIDEQDVLDRLEPAIKEAIVSR